MVRTWILGAAFALSSVVAGRAIAGCGGGSGAAGGCEALAAAVCSKQSACGPGSFAAAYGDVETCTKRFSAACSANVELPGARFTADNLTRCTNALGDLGCPDVAPGFTTAAACSVLSRGTLADGAECISHDQCQSGHCSELLGHACGTCDKVAGEGADCNDFGVACAEGLTCDVEALKCVPSLQRGDDCLASSYGCADGQFCVQGTCGSLLAAGTPCDPNDDLECDYSQDLACDAQQKKCVKLTVMAVGVGESCQNYAGSNVEVVCALGTYCQENTGAPTCAPTVADGAACHTDSGDPCQPSASCIEGVCSLAGLAACK